MIPNKSRHFTVILITIILTSILVLRAFYLQVIQYQFFKEKAEQQLKGIILLHPHRGNIYDRNKVPLAITEKTFSVFAVKNEMNDITETARITAEILNENPAEMNKNWRKTRSNFLWVKRQVPTETALKLRKLHLRGIGFVQTEKRVYPQNHVGAQIMGYVGVDNQGLSGLEYRFDKKLKGSAGKIILERDPRGFQLLTGQRKTIPNYDGFHIISTIDTPIQYAAEKALKKGVANAKAKGGKIIVMNPKNGDILAMAAYPNFNPNEWENYESTSRKNRAVTDVYEPGSIFKTITIAGALEEGVVTPETVFDVPEQLPLYNIVIKEAHERPEGESSRKTVTDIYKESLNVGTSLIAMKLTDKKLHQYVEAFGFGQPTEIQLSGESKGIARKFKNWSKVDVATISFGQGIAVTALQIINATSAIANHGVLMTPRIVDYLANDDFTIRHSTPIRPKRQVISKKTAAEMTEIMETVVREGTAKNVQIPGYSIAGKTGTAQKVAEGGHGYESGAYIASFVGFFPAKDAQVIILVSIDTPRTVIWGSAIAGPVFKEVAEFIINYKQIPPS